MDDNALVIPRDELGEEIIRAFDAVVQRLEREASDDAA